MAGGYGNDINETVQVQVNTYRVALEYWRRWASIASSGAADTAPRRVGK